MKIFMKFFWTKFLLLSFLKTPQIRQDENWNFCKYAPLEVCWEKFSLGRADDVRTELLKLQITSPWCESRECEVSSRVRDGLWWRWYLCLDLDHNDSLWTVECPHTSLHTPAPLVTLSPHLTSASWHSLQQSTGPECCRCCSLFTIGHGLQPSSCLRLQVSGQYAAYGHQWLIMSEPCHRNINRSRWILVAPWLSLHLYMLSILTHDEKVHYKSWAWNYLPGGLFVVRITGIGALAVSLVRPLTLRLWCVQTRIRRGEFSGVVTTTPVLMRSQFHIPFQPRLQPELKYESRTVSTSLNIEACLKTWAPSEMQSDSFYGVFCCGEM